MVNIIWKTNMLRSIFVLMIVKLSSQVVAGKDTTPLDEYKKTLKYFEIVELESLPNFELHYGKKFRIFERNLRFIAFNQTFEIALRESLPVYKVEIDIHENGSMKKYDLLNRDLNNFEGNVKGLENSYVSGYFTLDGHFKGFIISHKGIYFLEPIYDTNQKNLSNPVVLIYRVKDTIYPGCLETGDGHLDCQETDVNRYKYGNHKTFPEEEMRDRLEKRRADASVQEEDSPNTSNTAIILPIHPKSSTHGSSSFESATDVTTVNNGIQTNTRPRVCYVEIVTDYSLHQRHHSDEDRTIMDIVNNVRFLDNILHHEDLDGIGMSKKVRIFIKKISLYKDENNGPLADLEFPQSFETKHKRDQNYCLTIGLMNRHLSAEKRKAITPGKICSPDNTVFITPVSRDGQFISTASEYVSTVYSVINAFGVDRSRGKDCSSDTNKLDNKNAVNPMTDISAYVIDRYNERKKSSLFRRCNLMPRSTTTNYECLIPYKSNVCGNGVVDPGEECDCGFPENCDHIDQCCTPPGGNGQDEECTLRRSNDSQCSSKDPCCSPDCHFFQEEDKVYCGTKDGICNPSFCKGTTAKCPAYHEDTNGLPCMVNVLTHDYMMCHNGKCNATLCGSNGLQPCQCEEGSIYECHSCCQDSKGKCESVTYNYNMNIRLAMFFQPDGSPCTSKENGVCIAGMCISMEEDPTYSSNQLQLSSRTDAILICMALGYGFYLFRL